LFFSGPLGKFQAGLDLRKRVLVKSHASFQGENKEICTMYNENKLVQTECQLGKAVGKNVRWVLCAKLLKFLKNTWVQDVYTKSGI
jgi:hypothetical protein